MPADGVLEELLRQMSATPPGDRRAALRTEVIELALPLVVRLTGRFRGRGEAVEDLVQVGAMALIKAVDGYDPNRGVPFAPYLIPTVLGEIKRHFRDKGWDVRVPRPLQERRLAIERTTDELTQLLQRPPTLTELAAAMQVSVAEAAEGMVARAAYTCASLNEPLGDESDARQRQDVLGSVDTDLEQIADLESMRPLLHCLPERERAILTRRFFGNMTQAEIADEIGMSQMHVSRLLTRILSWLRRVLLDGENGEDCGHAAYPGTRPDETTFDVHTTRFGGVLRIFLSGAVTAAGTERLRRTVTQTVVTTRPRLVVIDMGAVPAMATAGASAVVAAYSACGHVGARLRLTRVAPAVLGVLDRAGVTRMIPDLVVRHGPAGPPVVVPAGRPRPREAAAESRAAATESGGDGWRRARVPTPTRAPALCCPGGPARHCRRCDTSG